MPLFPPDPHLLVFISDGARQSDDLVYGIEQDLLGGDVLIEPIKLNCAPGFTFLFFAGIQLLCIDDDRRLAAIRSRRDGRPQAEVGAGNRCDFPAGVFSRLLAKQGGWLCQQVNAYRECR